MCGCSQGGLRTRGGTPNPLSGKQVNCVAAGRWIDVSNKLRVTCPHEALPAHHRRGRPGGLRRSCRPAEGGRLKRNDIRQLIRRPSCEPAMVGEAGSPRIVVHKTRQALAVARRRGYCVVQRRCTQPVSRVVGAKRKVVSWMVRLDFGGMCTAKQGIQLHLVLGKPAGPTASHVCRKGCGDANRRVGFDRGCDRGRHILDRSGLDVVLGLL